MFDKYLIFLPDKYNTEQVTVECGCFCVQNIQRSIVQDLQDKGITVRFKNQIQILTRDDDYTFDDNDRPKLNTLYIHLIGGDYYSDDNYSKKKTEKERQILFLLAGKLGVKSIIYKTEILEINLLEVDTHIDIQQIQGNTKFTKKIIEKDGKSGKEIYINRGAPIYTLSDSIYQVENNIKSRFQGLDCKVFSYDFYKHNPNLRSFVYKRFNFKMSEVDYTSEIENDLDISFEVKTTLMDYGIGMLFDKHTVILEKINYTLSFFTDKELRLKLGEIIHFEQDPFSIIREIYDDCEDKNTGIYHITEYVRKYSKSCELVYFKKRHKNKVLTENYEDRLNHWIKDKGVETFEKECHKFTSSYQIRTWFKQELIYGDEEVEEIDEEDDDISNYGILKLKRENYQEYKESLMNTGMYNSPAPQLHSRIASQYPMQYQTQTQYRNCSSLPKLMPPSNMIGSPKYTTSTTRTARTSRRRYDTEEEEALHDKETKNKNGY